VNGIHSHPGDKPDKFGAAIAGSVPASGVRIEQIFQNQCNAGLALEPGSSSPHPPTMREVFLKIQYMVAWAGCNISPRDRTFSSYEDALKMYKDNLDKLSLRLEEHTTSTKIKIYTDL
jgi:hypothetical protein